MIMSLIQIKELESSETAKMTFLSFLVCEGASGAVPHMRKTVCYKKSSPRRQR